MSRELLLAAIGNNPIDSDTAKLILFALSKTGYMTETEAMQKVLTLDSAQLKLKDLIPSKTLTHDQDTTLTKCPHCQTVFIV